MNAPNERVESLSNILLGEKLGIGIYVAGVPIRKAGQKITMRSLIEIEKNLDRLHFIGSRQELESNKTWINRIEEIRTSKPQKPIIYGRWSPI